MKFTIYWIPPSKKNSKQIVCRWKFPQVLPSKKYTEWEKEQLEILKSWEMLDTDEQEKLPKKNLIIEVDFYWKDLRKWDLSNKFESIADMLVKWWILEDDNYEILSEVTLRYKELDRENPRCEINIK